MTENCFDSGAIQAFLDGELASDCLEAVSRHIASCDDCAILLAEAEEESAIAFTALDEEFNTFVPTNRLWTKISDSIEREKKPFWQTIRGYFSTPTIAAFASLVIVAGFFWVILTVKNNNSENLVAQNNSEKQSVNNSISTNDLPIIEAQTESENKGAGIVKATTPETKENIFRAVKTSFSTKENWRQPVKIQKPNAMENQNSQPPIDAAPRAANTTILGEESYVKTIATLEKTVDSRKDEVLKPSARFAFERDLAVTNDAITKMKAEVAKNPQNEAAKDVLRASYRNKIDLLNSVAEKSELMASLK